MAGKVQSVLRENKIVKLVVYSNIRGLQQLRMKTTKIEDRYWFYEYLHAVREFSNTSSWKCSLGTQYHTVRVFQIKKLRLLG
jgi:hypothetical protein